MLVDLRVNLSIPVGLWIDLELSVAVHRWCAVFRPQAVGASEGRDAALDGHAGAGHSDDVVGFGY